MNQQKLVDAWSKSGGNLQTAELEVFLPKQPLLDKTPAEKYQELRVHKAEERLAPSRVSKHQI